MRKLILAWLVPVARADLPLHCLYQDILGDWDFRLGAADQDTQPTCGHAWPNRVESLLNLDETNFVGFPYELVRVSLTEEFGEGESGGFLQSKVNDHAGNWTMLFDEGLEVRGGDMSFLAHFKFGVVSDDLKKKAKTGDNWEKIALYKGMVDVEGKRKFPVGEVYTCDCTRTTVGWYRKGTKYGCFYGVKTGAYYSDQTLLERHDMVVEEHELMDPSQAEVVDTVAENVAPAEVRESKAKMTSKAKELKTSSAVMVPVKDFEAKVTSLIVTQKFTGAEGDEGVKNLVKLHRSDFEDSWKAENMPNMILLALQNPPSRKQSDLSRDRENLRNAAFLQRRSNSTNPVPPSWVPKDAGVAGVMAGSEVLPLSWDWSQKIENLGAEFDQGPCGSCYAFSTVLMLQMRFKVEVWKNSQFCKGNNTGPEVELAWTEPVGCSFMSEGCQGGFPVAVGRFIQDKGVSSFADDEKDPKCNGRAAEAKFFAADYGYVGGFAQGANEYLMMREIHDNGPIVLEIDVGSFGPAFGMLRPMGAAKPLHGIDGRLVSDGKTSDSDQTLPWVYTTHALLAVGWGEDMNGKYWIVRNSWGTGWGAGGYGKITRGTNAGGVETSAAWIKPDMSRGAALNLKKNCEIAITNKAKQPEIKKQQDKHHHDAAMKRLKEVKKIAKKLQQDLNVH